MDFFVNLHLLKDKKRPFGLFSTWYFGDGEDLGKNTSHNKRRGIGRMPIAQAKSIKIQTLV